MTQRQPRKLRGFTLTEIAIVLGIIGLILGAVWSAASSVYLNMRVSTASEKLLQMAQGVKSLHAVKSQFDAAAPTFANLAQAGAFPNDTYKSTYATSTNPFGGAYLFVGENGGTEYSIGFSGVPGEACTKLVLGNMGGGTSQSIAGYRVAAAASNATAPADVAHQTAPTIVVINGECAATNNFVYFYFKLGS